MPNKSTMASVDRCYQKGNKRGISTVSTARGNIALMEKDINIWASENCFEGEKPLSSLDIFKKN